MPKEYLKKIKIEFFNHLLFTQAISMSSRRLEDEELRGLVVTFTEQKIILRLCFIMSFMTECSRTNIVDERVRDFLEYFLFLRELGLSQTKTN
jgi:hypothetical protein